MEISILQAVLCGIVYWLAVGNLPFVGLWSLQRPLVCGMITGLILGHPVQGAVIGATINLVYLGFMSAGGSMPADMALAGILGTAYAIAGGLDTDTALALAVPIGILGTIVWAGRMTFDSFFVHIADKYIEKEEYHKIWRAYDGNPVCTGCIFRSKLHPGNYKYVKWKSSDRIPDHRWSDACTWYCDHTAVHL